MNQDKIYSDNEIVLEYFSHKHLTDEYRAWFHDKHVTLYNSHGLFPYTKKQSEQFLKDIEEGSNKTIVFAISALNTQGPGKFTLKDPLHIGNISLQEIDYINRSAEIAWVIGDKNYWGQGIATRAGHFVLEHAFYRLNLNRIWTGVVSDNIGMIKVVRKLGMRQEGLYTAGIYLHGKYQNVKCYAILRESYPSIEIENKEGL